MAERLAVTKTYKLYIDGAFPRSESGRSLTVEDGQKRVLAHVAHASRKDLRDAVEAAAAAQPKWGASSAYNRGQVLYRMAEMMEGKRDELVEAIEWHTQKRKGIKARHQGIKANSRGRKPADAPPLASASKTARREVDAAIDRLVCFAGWSDKYAQVLGCNNPVAGPYYNFTIPEPTGVVGVLAPDEPALLGLISLISPPLCAGNAIVAISSDANPLPAVVFSEACATSDVPAGVVNVLTGRRAELIDHLARHRNVNGISAANVGGPESTILKLGVAENLKRVHIAKIGNHEWFDSGACEGPWTIEPFIEFKTIWHPAAT